MTKRRTNVLRWLAIAILMMVDVRMLFGCAPVGPEIIFVHSVHPDFPLDRYANGDLGVLNPGFARSYLVVAYRHLTGVGVSPQESKALASLWRERLMLDEDDQLDRAVDEWLAERTKISAAGAPPKIDSYLNELGRNHYMSITNCQTDAFQTAARTLRQRSQQFGPTNAGLIAWTQTQDQVFGNCSGGETIPTAAPANAQSLERADRAYQIAAAHFYARKFDEAAHLFSEIAKDNASPWRKTATLLVARSLIRKATLAEKPDPAVLAEAETQLKRIVEDRSLIDVHPSARRLLSFVEYRLDPEKRVRALAGLVLERNSGGEIKQRVIDYTRLLDRYEDEDHKVTLTPSAKTDDVTDWIFSFQAKDDASLEHSLQRWEETSSPAWLVAAMQKIPAKHPKTIPLLAAAAGLRSDSPAFLAAAYHSVRLSLEAGRTEQARQRLDELLALKATAPVSARNQLLEMRTRLARNAEEFFHFAQRAPAMVSFNEDGQETPILESELSGTDGKLKPYLSGRVAFAEDSVNVINDAFPISLLKDSAMATAIPAHLRRQLAIAAWTRAVLLGQDDVAQTLAPVLHTLVPEMKAQLDVYTAAKDAAERKDAALYLLLKFPGMRPYVEEGLARLTALQEIDDYRDNWWRRFNGEEESEDPAPATTVINPSSPGFLTPAERSAFAAEKRKLEALQCGSNELCLRAVDWARRSPGDPRLPEALHLAVKSTRFGCRDKQTRQYSKLAYDTLHKQYPNSPWAKQTKYFYGQY